MPETTDPGYETLRFKTRGHGAWIRLDRPERLNAFTPKMWAELAALGQALVADPGDVRALVLSGEGRAFSSGIDTAVLAEGLSAEGLGAEALAGDRPALHTDPAVAAILRVQDAYTWLAEAPFLTIAAVRGFAFGAGLQLAMACDVRIAARGTKLGLLELQYGILPDLGGTQRLPRLVGPGKAIELIATAARIDADEALRIGLVERVVSDEELWQAADALAEQVAAQPPLAVKGVKRAIRAALDGRSVREGLLVEAEAQAVCVASADFREAVAAFVEGRAPRYTGA